MPISDTGLGVPMGTPAIYRIFNQSFSMFIQGFPSISQSRSGQDVQRVPDDRPETSGDNLRPQGWQARVVQNMLAIVGH